MNTFLMLSLILLVFMVMYFIQKRRKSLHLLLVGVAVALLYVNHFYQHEGNQDYLVLLLSLLLFGKLLKDFRQA
jgi:predicted membrane protein